MSDSSKKYSLISVDVADDPETLEPHARSIGSEDTVVVSSKGVVQYEHSDTASAFGDSSPGSAGLLGKDEPSDAAVNKLEQSFQSSSLDTNKTSYQEELDLELEGLNADVPYSGMKKIIMILLALLVVVFIGYCLLTAQG